MSWRKELTALIASDAAIVALIGNKFYAARAPFKEGTEQTRLPFAVYKTVSNKNTNSKSSASKLEFRTIQIDCISNSVEKAEEVFRAIRAKIENHSSATGEIRRIVYVIDVEEFDEDNRFNIISAEFLLTLNLE
jgi:hypothetical protein